MSSYQYQIDITHHITHDRSQTRILLFFLTRLLIRALTLTPHSFSDHHLSISLSIPPSIHPSKKSIACLFSIPSLPSLPRSYCTVTKSSLSSLLIYPASSQNPKPKTHPSTPPTLLSRPPVLPSKQDKLKYPHLDSRF